MVLLRVVAPWFRMDFIDLFLIWVFLLIFEREGGDGLKKETFCSYLLERNPLVDEERTA